MAFDLDSPNIVATLHSKIELQEANLRGLETYARGARYTLWIAILLFAGAVFAYTTDKRTLAAWLVGYATLAAVTNYLFAPLLAHYTSSAHDELVELRDLLTQAVDRKKAKTS